MGYTPFKMKNSALRMSAKTGSPMHANYASPAKDSDPHKTTIDHKPHDEKSNYPGDSGDDPLHAEFKRREKVAKDAGFDSYEAYKASKEEE
jgi:hypothetical protein